MKIPKFIKRKQRIYKLLKVYENFALFENIKTKTKICFDFHELGLIENKSKIMEGSAKHPENVIFF